jgi:hypothetical protein
MGALFDATVLEKRPAHRGCTRVLLAVGQIHADAGQIARVRPERGTRVTTPDPARTPPLDVISAIVAQSAKRLSQRELRAFVSRLIAGATDDNPARHANPIETMDHGATGDFSFVRDVRVRAIEVFYLPLLEATTETRAFAADRFGVDFAVKEREGDPYVDDPDDSVNYRFCVELEARIEARFAAHLTVGVRFEPPAIL